MKIKLLSLFSLWFFLFLAISCNDNPAGPDPPERFTQKLSGKVILENQTEHSNALIYLDSLNRGVSSDSGGNYTLEFGGGDTLLSGTFEIIYFLNDFDIDTTRYALVNGKVQLDTLDVDGDGFLPDKFLKQILLVEGWTDTTHYRIGDFLEFTGRFTNVTDRKIEIFIPSFWGVFGWVSLYNENYWSANLTPSDPVASDCRISLLTGEHYEGKDKNRVPAYNIIDETLPLGNYVVVTYFVVENRLIRWDESKFSKFISTEWYKIHRGTTPFLDALPNKYKFPIVEIVE